MRALFRGKVVLICGAAYLALLVLLLSIAGVLLLCFRPETLGVHLNRTELALIALPMISIFFTVLKIFFLGLPPPKEGRLRAPGRRNRSRCSPRCAAS